MPQNTGLILYNSDVGADIGRIVFHERSVCDHSSLPKGHVEHFANFQEPCKAPVTLLLCETVMRRMMVVD